MSYVCDRHIFHIMVFDGLTYMCMAEEEFGRYSDEVHRFVLMLEVQAELNFTGELHSLSWKISKTNLLRPTARRERLHWPMQ